MGCVFGKTAAGDGTRQRSLGDPLPRRSSKQTLSNDDRIKKNKVEEEEEDREKIRHKGYLPATEPFRPMPEFGFKTCQGWPSWLCTVAGDVIKDWTPRRANTFEKLDKIGQGTYSNVYKARDLITGKIVALKKVRFDNLEPESVKFMAREILVLKKLNHPNVIKLEGLVTSRMSSSLYLVFEYMEHDLAGLAAVQGIKFTESQVKCFMKQLLSGLEHCHNHGVLHRDIKGSNLLIDNEGTLKIADFGLSCFYDPGHKQPMTSRVVTLWYRPPELLLGATYYGVSVDLWSAGCILAELLAGKPIMPGRTEVEQLHKIFKLCGSPSEEYWKKSRLPNATAGDEERIIEISDTRRRDPEGRMPSFSPAQEALFLIHERILESDAAPGGYNVGFGGDDEDEYGPRGGANRVVTRLVVSRMHVGCLLGKGGKIIEQMRMETKTHIRVLPRDHNLPRCVAMSEEIVQVLGDMNAVKNAIAIISSRLRESQHRDRSNFHGRLQSPERFFPPDDDYIPHMNHPPHRTSMDVPTFGSRSSASLTGARSNNYSSRQSAYTMESGPVPMADNVQPFSGEDLVFRILCPVDKIDSVVGESDGIIELLQNEIGVDVKVVDPVVGSDEQIIIISSEEGPDDELFPAQEALLHIQTRIVDLVPEKENIITTRLLVPSGEIGCLEGRDGLLSEMRKLTGANIQILPREEHPACVSGTDELLQIVGEIKAAREVLVEVTSRLRSYLYREFFPKDVLTPMAAPSPIGSALGLETASSNNINPSRETYSGNDLPTASSQNVKTVATAQPAKDSVGSSSELVKQAESERREDVPSVINRFHGPLVTRSTLEVVIPQHAVPKLITKSKNKLAQISELSGATVKLIEDGPEATENVIQISGTPEQAERAQSLLQGFILSTQEDGP